MRTIIVLIGFIALFVVSLIEEPMDDTLDAIAGSTNETYNVTVDALAGVTEEDEEDEDEEDHD